jgi:hypothetical protein
LIQVGDFSKEELKIELPPTDHDNVIQEEKLGNMQYNDLLASQASSLNFSIDQ